MYVSFVNKNGHEVYSLDDLGCVCINFDYWGVPSTLMVPYAKYRPPIVTSISNTKKEFKADLIKEYSFHVFDEFVYKDIKKAALTDERLQAKLIRYRKDNCGRSNTNRLIEHGSPAAEYCRGISTPKFEKGYFDLGNLYETVILLVEADYIDSIDPTARDYPYRRLGSHNPNGRFGSEFTDRHWTSTIGCPLSSVVCINSDSATFCIDVHMDRCQNVIPTRVVRKEENNV